MKLLRLPLALVTLTALTGCAAPFLSSAQILNHPNNTSLEQATTTSVSTAMLAHRHFVLEQVDNIQVPQGNTMFPGIDFYEGDQLAATFCNELQGNYHIVQSTISAQLIPRNQQSCGSSDKEKWEAILVNMLAQGATLSWKKPTLTLRNAQHIMHFRLKDWVY